MLDMIEARIARLRDHPRIGRTRDDILPGLRARTAGRYLVLYDVDPSTTVVRILRVLHGARDMKALFE